MTIPKAKFAGLALIAALCAGFTLGLTAPAWAGSDEHRPWENDPTVMSLGKDAYSRGDYAGALAMKGVPMAVIAPTLCEAVSREFTGGWPQPDPWVSCLTFGRSRSRLIRSSAVFTPDGDTPTPAAVNIRAVLVLQVLNR